MGVGPGSMVSMTGVSGGEDMPGPEPAPAGQLKKWMQKQSEANELETHVPEDPMAPDIQMVSMTGGSEDGEGSGSSLEERLERCLAECGESSTCHDSCMSRPANSGPKEAEDSKLMACISTCPPGDDGAMCAEKCYETAEGSSTGATGTQNVVSPILRSKLQKFGEKVVSMFAGADGSSPASAEKWGPVAERILKYVHVADTLIPLAGRSWWGSHTKS